MQPRAFDILQALVREFIAHGEPVSSGWLYEHHDFGIKPAMIRAELNNLADCGFLEQPHHSAGRVPADKAYEYFAEQAIDHERARTDEQLASLLAGRAWHAAIEKLSDDLGILGALCARDGGETYKEGLEALIDNLEWDSRSELASIIRDFEALDDRMEEAAHRLPHNGLEVFIGKKSPVTKSGRLSVVVRGCEMDGREVFLFAIGPKRMDYEKVIKLMKGIE